MSSSSLNTSQRRPLPQNVVIAADPQIAFEDAAKAFVDAACGAIASRGKFTVALSGGSTPKRLFELLASPQWKGRIDWSRVSFFWGDERFVPPDDAQSNFRMAQEALLSKIPVRPENVIRFATERGTPEEAASEYELRIRKFFGKQSGIPQFDLILLGLGTNGHTASLFPHRPTLWETSALVLADYVEEVKQDRLTMTVPLINYARSIVFLVVGSDKAEIVRDILVGPFQPQEWPAQLIVPDSGTLSFIVDAEAARLLPPLKPR